MSLQLPLSLPMGNLFPASQAPVTSVSTSSHPPGFNYPLHISNSINRSNDYLKGTPNGMQGVAAQLPTVQDPATRQILSQLTNALNSTNHGLLSLANVSGNIQNPEELERQVVAKPALMYLA